jgi:hypothetical protein
MTPTMLLHNSIDPALALMTLALGPLPAVTPAARVTLLAIAGQESLCEYRRQTGGPARSYWQFEGGPSGGLAGLLAHRTAGPWARDICEILDIPADRPTVFEAMAWNDTLAPIMARLLLWTDAAAIPDVGQPDAAYAMYLRLWRPGKEDSSRWPDAYRAAVAAVTGTMRRDVQP